MLSTIILGFIGTFLSYTWWLWLFFILIPLFESTWIAWRQFEYEHNDNEYAKCILFEIKMPREILRSPRAMEQVLNSFQQMRNAAGNPSEKWIDGEVTRPFSLEIVSFGGEVHFYIRRYFKHRHLVEAAFYSHYPDVELVEVDDYIDRLPKNYAEMKDQGYDLWGTELLTKNPGSHPIRTYLEFESPDDEKQYDPISSLLEVLAQVKKEQTVAIQIILSPAGPDWAHHFQDIVEDMRMGGGGGGHAKSHASHGEDSTASFSKLFMRTPGETDKLKAIEANLSKPAFETILRLIYLSPREIYYDSFPRRGVIGAFNQYGSMDTNYFIQNYEISTLTYFWTWPHLFPKLRNVYRKERLLHNFRHRETIPHTFMGKLITSHPLNWNFHSKSFLMTTQCLATIFHPPTRQVLTAPHMERVNSRKTGPPAGLAIFGDEDAIKKFQ